jgi:hypothetical protein
MICRTSSLIHGLTVDQVFLQAMSTLIERSDHDLRYFTSSGFHSKQYGIPSWVRNFSAALDSDGATYEVSRYNSYPLYNAACSTKADLGVLSDRIIFLAGVYIDTIDHVGLPVQTKNWPQFWSVASQWYITFFTNDSHNLDPILKGELWRILTSDVLEQLGKKWSRIAKSDEPGTIMPDGMDGIATWLSHTPTPQLYILHSPLLHTAKPCAERSNAISNSAFPKAVLVMLSRFYTAEEFHLCFGYLKKISKKMH